LYSSDLIKRAAAVWFMLGKDLNPWRQCLFTAKTVQGSAGRQSVSDKEKSAFGRLAAGPIDRRRERLPENCRGILQERAEAGEPCVFLAAGRCGWNLNGCSFVVRPLITKDEIHA
jgi:hypothetical protein